MSLKEYDVVVTKIDKNFKKDAKDIFIKKGTRGLIVDAGSSNDVNYFTVEIQGTDDFTGLFSYSENEIELDSYHFTKFEKPRN